MLETASRQFADVVVAVPTGRIDHQSAAQFEAALAPLVHEACSGKGALVLDFTGVEYISSVGLRALMIAAKQLRAAGAKIAVTNLRPVVAEILAISRFDRLLGVFPSVRGAIELFSAAGLAAFDAAQPPPAR
jgi:anti-anti-sigma factor